MSYIIVTNFWNEPKESFESIISNIGNQNLKPVAWVWINDGSTNNVCTNISYLMNKYLDHAYAELVNCPLKKVGNMNTIGHAWNRAIPVIIHALDYTEADYLAVVDVDGVYSPEYFERIISFMEIRPIVGVAVGQPSNTPKKVPTGGGKVVRADIIRNIEKYWDLAPDSFINIKARVMGYKWHIFQDLVIETSPSHLYTKAGKYRQGRMLAYAGHPFITMLYRLIVTRSVQLMRGWLHERFTGWRCEDSDIIDYNKKLFMKRTIEKILRWFN